MVYELIIEETNVKRSREFRQLQQKTITYIKRNLQLNDDKATLLMVDYIEMTKESKEKSDKLAALIEEAIKD